MGQHLARTLLLRNPHSGKVATYLWIVSTHTPRSLLALLREECSRYRSEGQLNAPAERDNEYRVRDAKITLRHRKRELTAL